MVETQPSRVEGESWYFFAEVEEKSSQPGAFVCHDKIDSLFMVLFDKALEKEAKQVHQGYTLVLKNAHARLTTFVHTIAVNDARNLKVHEVTDQLMGQQSKGTDAFSFPRGSTDLEKEPQQRG